MGLGTVELAGPPAHVPDGYQADVHATWVEDDPRPGVAERDGSLLFVDVSGFTTLSERLAKRGPIGGEELSEIINTVFEGMLGDLRSRGGDVLAFGGDALCTLFTGPQHERRAAAAGMRIQAGMRPFRRLRTDAGVVSLRVSAGLASGRVHLFLSGASHRALLAAGPVVSQTCALEALAAPGELVCSEQTAAALGERHAGAVRSDGDVRGRLVRGIPDHDPAPPATGALARSSALALPPHLHDHVPGDGEHRLVTVGFVQFKGSDAVVARSGPALLGGVLHDLVAATQEACAEHDVTFVGSDVDRDGGKLVLVTGAPAASDTAEDQMLQALRAVVARDVGLHVRAGAHRGRAFVGDIGTPERRTWTVMGDAVNTAARVMGHAPDHEVLATRALLEHTRSRYALHAVAPFRVKGKRQPLHAAVVGRPRGVKARADAAVPLIGREAELGALRDAIAGAQRGESGAVELVGEPGIGKSRLVAAALQMAEQFSVVAVAAGPYGRFTPYLSVRDPLRKLLGIPRDALKHDAKEALRAAVADHAPDLEEWLPLVGMPLGIELEPTARTAALSPEFARARMHRAMARLLDAMLGDAPTLLVIEDAHWLDEASADLLAHIIEALRGGHRMVLVTRRPGDAPLILGERPNATILELGPLAAGDARSLILESGRTGGITRAQADELIERAAGNPLFLTELATAVRSGADLAEMPDSVEALIAVRVDALPRTERAVLRHAAVLGVTVPVALLEALVDLEPLITRRALHQLEDYFVDAGPGLLRFRHALLRDAAYGALPFRRRRELHARAGDLIEHRYAERLGDVAALLSLHYHAARRWQATWDWSCRAGDHALRSGAPVEAAAQLRRALDARRYLDVSAGEAARVAELLGDCCELAGRYEEAARAYGTARPLARGDGLRLAELCRKQGRLQHGSRALAWYTRGRRALEQAPESRETQLARTKLAVESGLVRLRQGRYRDATRLLETAVADAHALGDRATLAHAYYLLDWAYTDLGEPQEHLRMAALPIYEELGDQRGQAIVLNNLGVDALQEGEWARALEFFERARVAHGTVGDVLQEAMAEMNAAEVLVRQGHLDACERTVRHALETTRAVGHRLATGVALTVLGHAVARAGRADEAGEILAGALANLDATGAEPMALEARALDAERLALDGRATEALALARACVEAICRAGGQPGVVSGCRRVIGLALAQTGDFDGAHAELQAALDVACDAGAAYEEALAHRALAALAERLGGDPEPHLQAAAPLIERLGIVRVPAMVVSPPSR